ncbi:MAG TPA: hypothetical protein ENI23_05780 [bacterium]|nr:hypothetical protein [bacterium]
MVRTISLKYQGTRTQIREQTSTLRRQLSGIVKANKNDDLVKVEFYIGCVEETTKRLRQVLNHEVIEYRSGEVL